MVQRKRPKKDGDVGFKGKTYSSRWSILRQSEAMKDRKKRKREGTEKRKIEILLRY